MSWSNVESGMLGGTHACREGNYRSIRIPGTPKIMGQCKMVLGLKMGVSPKSMGLSSLPLQWPFSKWVNPPIYSVHSLGSFSPIFSGENRTFDGSDPICPQILFLSPLIFEGTGYRYIQIFLASIFCCFKMLQRSCAKVKMPKKSAHLQLLDVGQNGRPRGPQMLV